DSVFRDNVWYDVGGIIDSFAQASKMKGYRRTFSPYERSRLDTLADELPTYNIGGPPNAGPLRHVESHLLTLNQVVAARLLAAHPKGYSTTTHDLINDLLPF